uniref:Uncharacterized protein n=1 Tax=Oryza meridionalis TaxID=40149 RepID=A0A0E0E0V0_9ORYZ
MSWYDKESKQTKYKDVPATAIDLFKECHRSSKNGFSESVKNIIANMEAIIDDPLQDGEEPKNCNEVISQVMPKTNFLQNVGLESAAPKRNGKAIVAAWVQELEAELDAERQDTAKLREKLHGQQHELDSLKKKVDEAEAARMQQLEETERLQKSSDETNALLRRLLALNTSFGEPR